MELTATILLFAGLATIVTAEVLHYRLNHFQPRHESAATAVARARQIQRVAMTFAAATVVCGATTAALNNGHTTTWVYGAVMLVAGAAECFLIARVRIPDVEHLRALGFDREYD
ncbi:hypothetical protein [Gordonia sp. KTR9]|uniref:hypothetical protein n=1 Tax=Gordonia sp. KTR9 TaxID=337191 RepID=UPI0002F74391|nr:hypothetical protein [Gordonia sp. KTR9]